MAIERLFIANRGEIAVRIIRAARELGMRTVQAYSDADVNSLPVRIADESMPIGEAVASRSYLNIKALVAAARTAGADAVHPGYGFLAENGDFADAVEDAGMVFVGPTGDCIRRLGDKVEARKLAETVGLPLVPGSQEILNETADSQRIAQSIGFPLMIKAAAGGGGRGIRVANDLDEFIRLAPQARLEAQSAFGDGSLYLEALVSRARHVEVQILGDGKDALHVFDRECSLQRRRQKIWEEAPASAVPQSVRKRLCRAAARFARAVGYRGAGTLEFLYDEDSQDFYFLEMNTRIQVEHPVTEMVTGIDLVREGLKIAEGAPLSMNQEEIRLRGHAIEVRINAEDPGAGFLPQPGTVESVHIPGGPGVRFDSALFAGCEIPPFYDSLIGKLIVWDSTRPAALRRLKGALAELEITGIRTTQSLHAALADDQAVQNGAVSTTYLDSWLKRGETTTI